MEADQASLEPPFPTARPTCHNEQARAASKLSPAGDGVSGALSPTSDFANVSGTVPKSINWL